MAEFLHDFIGAASPWIICGVTLALFMTFSGNKDDKEKKIEK